MVGAIEIISVLEYGASPLGDHDLNASLLQSDERWHDAPDTASGFRVGEVNHASECTR